MTELTGMVGFASPVSEKTFSRRHNLGIELAATLALAASLIVAATAVSIGMARAQSLAPPKANDSACYSALIPAALITGHHLSISALL